MPWKILHSSRFHLLSWVSTVVPHDPRGLWQNRTKPAQVEILQLSQGLKMREWLLSSWYHGAISQAQGHFQKVTIFFSLVILVTATKWMMAYSPSLNVQRSPSPCIDLEFKQHSLLIEVLFSSSEHWVKAISLRVAWFSGGQCGHLNTHITFSVAIWSIE